MQASPRSIVCVMQPHNRIQLGLAQTFTVSSLQLSSEHHVRQLARCISPRPPATRSCQEPSKWPRTVRQPRTCPLRRGCCHTLQRPRVAVKAKPARAVSPACHVDDPALVSGLQQAACQGSPLPMARTLMVLLLRSTHHHCRPGTDPAVAVVVAAHLQAHHPCTRPTNGTGLTRLSW
jgi:hypothetical protein